LTNYNESLCQSESLCRPHSQSESLCRETSVREQNELLVESLFFL